MKFMTLTTSIVAAFTFANTAMAATSADLILQGTVSVVSEISVAANASSTSLNIRGGETNKLVASVDETSNNLLGYKIIISSPTGGELRHTADASKATSYKVRYNGASAVTPTTSGVEVKNSGSLAGLQTASSTLAVDVTAYDLAPAGTYEDTLTISIQSNN